MYIAEQLRQLILNDFDEATYGSEDSPLLTLESSLLTLRNLYEFCDKYGEELQLVYNLLREADRSNPSGKEFVDLMQTSLERAAEACEQVVDDITDAPPVPGYSKEEAVAPYLSAISAIEEMLLLLVSANHVDALTEYLDVVLSGLLQTEAIA